MKKPLGQMESGLTVGTPERCSNIGILIVHYLTPIIGRPIIQVDAGEQHPAGMLTEKGFVVCDPLAIDTAWSLIDQNDLTERCELKRGHLHIRIGPPRAPGEPVYYFGLEVKSGWVFILPFRALPPASRAVFLEKLPVDFKAPATMPETLQEAAAAHRAELEGRKPL